ncbi:MAG: hypothetical protein ACI9NT_002629, partial [Bacteroidia bacterium]
MTRPLNSIVDFSRVLLEKVVELPRNIKQACMLSLDMVFVAGAMWAAIALRYGHLQFQLGI